MIARMDLTPHGYVKLDINSGRSQCAHCVVRFPEYERDLSSTPNAITREHNRWRLHETDVSARDLGTHSSHGERHDSSLQWEGQFCHLLQSPMQRASLRAIGDWLPGGRMRIRDTASLNPALPTLLV